MEIVVNAGGQARARAVPRQTRSNWRGHLDFSQADQPPGWVEYDITNPATGAVQTKMSYVCRAGDLYMGCGVYKSLAAR